MSNGTDVKKLHMPKAPAPAPAPANNNGQGGAK